MTIAAELRSNRRLEEPTIKATVQRPDGTEAPLVLLPDPAKEHRYTAEFEADEPGSYTLIASAEQAERTLAATQTAINVAPAVAESEDVGVNRPLLERLAQHRRQGDRPQ